MMSTELIFGIHTITALLNKNANHITKLYLQQERHDQRLQQIIDLAKAQHIAIKLLSKIELDKLLPEANHQGVIAHCASAINFTEADIEKILTELNGPPFLLILDGVQDPHNLGACLRSANAAGVHMVIAPRDRSVGMTPAVRKVACGAAEVTPFIQVTNLARTLEFLKKQGIWLYGAAGDAQNSLYQTKLTGPLALVLGAEENGLRRLTRDTCDDLLFIPMFGSVGSLNVSVATGVFLFEAVRQRGK
jgi:23S rRNA (guanosine2251-2'-O)-methyltransferase